LGQLGNGVSTTGSKHTPTPVVLVSAQSVPFLGFASVTTGFFHSCARVGSDDSAVCWGLNADGQFGDDSTTNRVAASFFGGGVVSVSEIYAGGSTTCVTLPSGAMQCTGDNSKGQLGRGKIGGQFSVLVDVLNMPPA
jgi:alpha-tubulin suppressor-like RCC1 family protein